MPSSPTNTNSSKEQTLSDDFKIDTDDRRTYIRISDDDGDVWMTFWFPSGHVNASLNKEQAKKMVVALQKLIGEEQTT